MFRIKSMFRVRPILGVLVIVGAIALLFASYIVSANVGHAQTTSRNTVSRSSTTSSTSTTQVPTSIATTAPTATSTTAVATDTPVVVPTAPSNPVVVTNAPTVTTGTGTTPVTGISATPPVTGTSTATPPVDTASSSIDQLPGNMSYYCDRVQYLGGKWPVHLYIGGCLVREISQYSWTIDSIKSMLNSTVCATNEICTISVNTVAYFLHNEINHMAAESTACGGRGIYVHVFGAFFRTHPVC